MGSVANRLAGQFEQRDGDHRVARHADSDGIHVGEFFQCRRIRLFGRFSQPTDSLGQVVLVHQRAPEPQLGNGVARRGQLAQTGTADRAEILELHDGIEGGGTVAPPGRPALPVCSGGQICRDALARAVHDRQPVGRVGVALRIGTPQPLQRLRVIPVDSVTTLVQETQQPLGMGNALSGGPAHPARRRRKLVRRVVQIRQFHLVQGIARGGSLAQPVGCLLAHGKTASGLGLDHQSQIELCLGQTLPGRLEIPLLGLVAVALQAPAVLIHATQLVFGFGKTLTGGLAKPARRNMVIARHFQATVVDQAEVILAPRVAVARMGSKFAQRRPVALGAEVVDASRELGLESRRQPGRPDARIKVHDQGRGIARIARLRMDQHGYNCQPGDRQQVTQHASSSISVMMARLPCPRA
ncbi:MAG TPA: hypothetical protein VFX04_04445 [Rhodanobacteraceae bacterium]|nr:hypothetical protein [Rhodanobacteraceae bacterium]